MKTSKLNDWLQMAAALGVIIGLLLVAWEIRESNRQARAEAAIALNDGFMELARLEMQPDIAALWLKAESGAELSALEQMRFSASLEFVITTYDRVFYTMQNHDLFDDPVWEDWDGTIATGAEAYFHFALSRQWFERNQHWMAPGVREGISRYISENPLPSTASDGG